MGSNFARGPQGSPLVDQQEQTNYSAFLPSVLNQAATATTDQATVTSAADDDGKEPTPTPTDRPMSQSNPETLSTEPAVNTYNTTTPGSSLPPSTFATATTSGNPTQNSNTATETANAENNTSDSVVHAHDNDNGLSPVELAAAIIGPIIALMAFIGLVILCLRRNKRRQRTSSDASRGTRTSFFGGGWKEKWGSIRSSASSQHYKEPVVTSHSNNAYMTGLDTSSRSGSLYQHHSGGHYTQNSDGGAGAEYTGEPPPPYLRGAPEIPPLAAISTNISLPSSRRPSTVGRGDPHELHPLSPQHLAPPVAHFSPLSAADLPTPPFLDSSARSINSDVYSETASVHSARAARMSIGGPIGVEMLPSPLKTRGSRMTMKGSISEGSGASSGTADGKRHSDPFDDPSTPLSGSTPTFSALEYYQIHGDGQPVRR